MNIYHDEDATLDPLRGKKIAVIGYGSQGHAHALNLRDSGCDVRVGLRPDSASRKKAEAVGLRVVDAATAAREADIVMMLTPDEMGAEIYEAEIARTGRVAMFRGTRTLTADGDKERGAA